jgi:hypothetical protein
MATVIGNEYQLEESEHTKTAIVLCDCSSHILTVRYDRDEHLETLDFGIYTSGARGERWPWMDLIRHVWHVFKNRNPYGDWVMLQGTAIRQLQDWFRDLPVPPRS